MSRHLIPILILLGLVTFVAVGCDSMESTAKATSVPAPASSAGQCYVDPFFDPYTYDGAAKPMGWTGDGELLCYPSASAQSH